MPSFTQTVLHLVLFLKSVQEDYDDTIQGKETRYGKITSPEERAQVRKRKRRTLAEYFVSDGQPPDTSKDLPLDNDFNDVQAYFIPFGFSKDLPFLEGKSLTEPLVSEGLDSLTRQSMQTLCHGDWVNDEVINFLGEVCLNKHDVTLCDRRGGRKHSHTFNSYFMRRLFDKKSLDQNIRCVYKFANVATWSKKVPGENIFNMRYLFFPININDTH
jgi:hypothetical protein